MPSTTFNRPGQVENALENISPFRVPSGFFFRSHSGVVKSRTAIEAGRGWVEEYGWLNINRPDTHEFLSWVRWAWQTRTTFFIKHATTPGSGMPPLGSPSGSPTVNASQTGDSISTSGWTISTSGLLLPGDHIKIAGVHRVFEVLDPVNSDGSGNATININPAIYSAPSTGAAISTSDIEIRAKLLEEPNLPSVESSFWYDGLTLTFIEVP